MLLKTRASKKGFYKATFLSAGSRDIPVPCESGDKNVAPPAGRNACSTFQTPIKAAPMTPAESPS
jgi:hypothetical protein